MSHSNKNMNLDNKNIEPNFGVPEGYFEGFEAAVQARIAEEELRALVSTAGFIAPDGYFDQLEPSIKQQLPEKQTKVISLFGKRTLYAVASVAAVVVFVVNLIGNGNGNNENTLALDQVDPQLLVAYANSDAIAFTDAELMDFVSEEDLETSLFSEQQLSDESIETYLLENLDDIDFITTYEE